LRNIRRDATAGAFSGFRVSEWSVRRKVVAVLAVPVVLAAVFGGLRVRSELTLASDYSGNQQRATVLGPAVNYLTATERLQLLDLPWPVSNQIDAADPVQEYSQAESALKRADGAASLSASEHATVEQLLRTGATLSGGQGTGITADPSVALGAMNSDVTSLINSTLNTAGTPDPRVQALVQSLDGRLSLIKQQSLIKNAVSSATQLDSVWLAAEIGVEGSALDRLSDLVGGSRISLLKGANTTRLGEATSKKTADLVATGRMFNVYDALDSRLLSGVQGRVADQASSSKSRALTDAAIILTALLASLILALFVARALIVPLRKVRAGALEVANERLPETVARIRSGKQPDEFTPIPVHSREELGQLARAVDDMHKQAVNLATGEAQLRAQVGAMFVTLSRRNTTLVNQQLALIESLEQDEEDPQRLEQLFSLDHLATRMRRTAESLVILGGTEGRTASFEELSVSDVVHAAVSEVQDYQRVRIDAAPDRMIGGRAASDVVHLMAELIDNALSYSPPGSPVTIRATEEDTKVTIEIIDNGLGMAGDALAQANDSLKRGGEVTVDTARRMGLFVVSRLAEDHGLKVKLRRNSNGGGIIASITLPANVLVSDGPVEHVSILDSPAEVEEPVAPVVDDEPEAEYDPYLERIEDAIAAVTGLPRRRPGLVPGPAAPAAPAPVGMFEAPANPELPAAFEPTELPSRGETVASSTAPLSDPLTDPYTDPLADPLTASWTEHAEQTQDADAPSEAVGHLDEAETAEHDAEHDVESDLAEVVTPDFGAERRPAEPAAQLVEESPAQPAAELDVAPVDEPVDEPVAGPVAEPLEPVAAQAAPEPAYDAPVEEAPVRLQIRRPLSATAAASALEGDFVAEAPSEDSPIFGQLRSHWLTDDEPSGEQGEPGEPGEQWSANEVDRGWNAAERAESADAEGTTRTGLPVRRPGGRLLPGGVSQEPAKVVRDPEAIRNRLAAHAAGVSRGRAAAAAEPFTDDYAHEETGPA
jgi:signal transduction histidine kinase